MNKNLHFILAAGIALSACNNVQESKQETKADSTEQSAPAAATQQTGPDFSAMEAVMSKDSTNSQMRIELASAYYNSGNLEKAAYHYTIVYKADQRISIH
ncbi:MAG: hypothetical protein U0X76_05090 [Bacteroidia bacterium]